MADVKNKTVNIYIDQTAALNAFDALQKKADGFSKKIDDARQKQTQLLDTIKKSEAAAGNIDTLRKEYTTLGKEIDTATKSLSANKEEMKNAKQQMQLYTDKLIDAKAKQADLAEQISKAADTGKSTTRLQQQYAAVTREINLTIEKVQAQNNVFNRAEQSTAQLGNQIGVAKTRQKELNAEIKLGDSAVTTIKNSEKQFQSLSHTITANTDSYNKNKEAQKVIQTQIDSGLRPSMTETKNLVTKLRNELVKMSEDAPGYAEKFQKFQNARTELDRLSQSMNGVEKAQKSWLQEAKVVAFGVLIGNTVQSAIQAIGGYLGGIVSGNSQMSDSLAKVRQTTGLTAEEVKNLQAQLKSIDTRTAQADLLKIAEIGGQFNVPKEQLKGFVEQVDRVNVVLGSEFGGGAEQITTEMALLRNVFTDIKSDHIDKDIGNIANAVITLAQEGAATAPVISDFSKRLSPLISTAHLTSGAILGLGATMQELAVNPERGGTAVVKLFDKMISNAEAFAKVAGVSVDDFKKKLESDTWGAFLQVLEGFKKGGNNVVALNTTIQDLETSGVGAKEVLVKLSQNTDLLKSRSDLATDSLTKQNKITEQFAISNNNLAGETDKLQKKLSALLQSKTLSDFFSAGIQVISKFIDVLRAIPGFVSNNSVAFTLLAIGIASLNASYIKAALVVTLDTLAKIKNTVVTNVSAVASNLAAAAQLTYGLIVEVATGKIKLAAAATQFFSIILKGSLGPIGAVIITVGALVLIIGNLAGAFTTLTKEQKIFGEVQTKAAEDVASQRAALDTLTNAVTNNALSLDDRKKALNGLIAINPAYLSGLTLENVKTAEGKKIIDDYVASLDRMARAKATQALKEDYYKKSVDAAVKAQQASLNAPTSTVGIGLQAGLIVGGLGGFTGLGKAMDAQADVKKAQEDINALNAVNQKQINEENKLIDTQQKKMHGLKQGSIDYKNEQVKLNDLITTRNVLLGLETTSVKAQTDNLTNGLQVSVGLIDALKAKIKLLDDARGGLSSKALIDDNLAQRKKLQDELDALENKGADKKAKKEQSDHENLLKEVKAFNQKLHDLKFQSEQAAKTSDEKEIAAVKEKYAKIILEYQALTKKLKGTGLGLSFSPGEITAAENEELQSTIAKQKAKHDKEQQEAFLKNAAFEYENQKALSDKFFEEQKEKESQRFVAGEIDRKQYEANIAAIDVASKQQQIRNAEDYSAILEKAAVDVSKFKKEELQKQTADHLAALVKQQADERLMTDLKNQAATSRNKTNLALSAPGSPARLQALKAGLEEEKKQEMEALDKKEKEYIQSGIAYTNEFNDLRKDINDKYRKEELNADLETISRDLEYANQVVSIIEKFAQAKTSKENADLKNELKNNDTRKAALKKQLDSKLISQQEYNRQVTAIDNEAEAKKEALAKKQFERNKKFQLANAAISGAQSVLKTIEEFGPPIPPNFLGIGAMILTLATVAGEVAAITSAKYAMGGRVDHPGNGKINVASNIPTQPNGDDVLATVKRGEVILNEKQQNALGGPATFRSIGVPGFAGGGAIMKNFWETRPYQSINFTRIAEVTRIMKYADGGSVGAPVANTTPAPKVMQTDPAVLDALQEQKLINAALMQSLNNLNGQLAAGIQSNVSLDKMDKAYAKRERIKVDSAMGYKG